MQPPLNLHETCITRGNSPGGVQASHASLAHQRRALGGKCPMGSRRAALSQHAGEKLWGDKCLVGSGQAALPWCTNEETPGEIGVACQLKGWGSMCPWKLALIGPGGSLGCLTGDVERGTASGVFRNKGSAAGLGGRPTALQSQPAKPSWDAKNQQP